MLAYQAPPLFWGMWAGISSAIWAHQEPPNQHGHSKLNKE